MRHCVLSVSDITRNWRPWTQAGIGGEIRCFICQHTKGPYGVQGCMHWAWVKGLTWLGSVHRYCTQEIGIAPRYKHRSEAPRQKELLEPRTQCGRANTEEEPGHALETCGVSIMFYWHKDCQLGIKGTGAGQVRGDCQLSVLVFFLLLR